MIILFCVLFGVSFFLFGSHLAETKGFVGDAGKCSCLPLPFYGLLDRSILCHFKSLPFKFLTPYLRFVGSQTLKAGWASDISPERFLIYQLTLGLIFLSVAILFKASIVFSLLAALAGILWPLLSLKNSVRSRGREVDTSLPHLLDALTLMVEAGLDFMTALDRLVSRWKPSPLVKELQGMLVSVKTGMLRADALRQLKERLPFNSVQSFVSILVQADRFGVSIGPVLRRHAELLRFERFENADRAGRAASQKLLFPLIICIMPAVFVVVIGPTVARWISGGLNWIF